MSRIWQANSDWNPSAVFVNALGLKPKKSFPWIAVNGNHCVNPDGCPTSQLRYLLLLAPYGLAQSCKRWPWVKGSAPDTTPGRNYYSSTNDSLLLSWAGWKAEGVLSPSELCPFFSLPSALGTALSPSSRCYWGVQPLWAAHFPASHGLQPSLLCSVPTFPGAVWVVPFQGHFSLISFFHIFFFFLKTEKLQSAFFFPLHPVSCNL